MEDLSFEEIAAKCLEDIDSDRKITAELLTDIIQHISGGSDHKEYAFAAAKYVETLQRSNEQRVKIAAMIRKNESENSDLSDSDRNSFFEELAKAENE
jgi:hypothetical protein